MRARGRGTSVRWCNRKTHIKTVRRQRVSHSRDDPRSIRGQTVGLQEPFFITSYRSGIRIFYGDAWPFCVCSGSYVGGRSLYVGASLLWTLARSSRTIHREGCNADTQGTLYSVVFRTVGCCKLADSYIIFISLYLHL